jgi:cell division protein FtsI (penicillin-binding protein 3)
VVMDPRSGEILAMACVPEFDPNRYRTSDAARWRNRSITDTFEPGSTIKVLAVAAAMEEGVVDEETMFDCENGRFRYGGCTLHDMKPHSELSVREILKVSSNIGTAKIADKLGGQSLWTYLNNFGFGKKSGVDLPGEVPGLLRDWNNWSRIEVATHAFGQGFSVTALQLACAFSALANGGFLIEPYLVQTVRDEKGEVILDRKPRALRRVLSPRSAERALRLMEHVVEDGTGRAAGIRGFRVGGKTGTAQKFDSKAMAYSNERSVVSFVGILPVDDPDLVIVVVLDEPQGKASGGKTAAPVFRSIASRSMHYRRVPARDAGTEPPPRSFRFCSLASGTEGAGSHPGTAGPAFRGSGRWEMPELRFRPLRSALRVLDGLPVAIRLEGSGTVVFQDPLPGSLVGAGQTLYLRAVPGAAEGAGQG